MPYAIAQAVPLLTWLFSVAPVIWCFVRPGRPAGLAAVLAAATAIVVYRASAVAWIASLATVLVGFASFRRSGVVLVIVCVVAWVATTWAGWGYETV